MPSSAGSQKMTGVLCAYPAGCFHKILASNDFPDVHVFTAKSTQITISYNVFIIIFPIFLVAFARKQ